MRMPGFSGEASLSNSSETYRLFSSRMSLDGGQIVPAEGSGVVYMDNLPQVVVSLEELYKSGSGWGSLVPIKQRCFTMPKICIDQLGRRYKCGSFTVCPK